MKDKKLLEFLKKYSKDDLRDIIIGHYKFLVKKYEKLEEEYKDYRNKNLSKLAERVHDEKEFIFLQLQWYENYIKQEVK